MVTDKQISDAIDLLNQLDAADLGEYSYNEVLLALFTLAALSPGSGPIAQPVGLGHSGNPVRSANDE